MKNHEENYGQMFLNEIYTKDSRYTEVQMQAMSYYGVSEINLSTRIMDLLKRNDCTTLAQAAAFAEEAPINGYKGGEKAAGKIFSALDSWLNENPAWKTRVAENAKNFSEEQKEVFQKLSSALDPIVRIYWDQLAGLVEVEDDRSAVDRFLDMPFEQQISVILKHDQMRSSLERYWQKMTKKGIIEIREFESKLASTPLKFDAQVLIRCSLDTGIICEDDDYYLMKRKTVSDYMNSPDLNKKSDLALKLRINGAKLEEIGKSCNVSKERVRQVIAKQVRRNPPFFEDYFIEPFQAFSFTEKEFRRAFPEITKEGFGYLSSRYEKGKESFNELSADQYSGLWKKRISDLARMESESRKAVFKSSREAVLSVLEENIDHPLSMESFKEKYDKKIDQMTRYIQDHDLEARPLRPSSSQTLSNFLSSEKGIVFDRERKVRICNTDPKVIWETVDFARYRDLVISSELIYRDYSEFMAEQQVRDGYELFYIIKNSLSEFWHGDFRIRCRRVPIIVFDEVSEADQAVRLLKELSPVSHGDYYDIFKQRFGIESGTAQGNKVIQRALKPYDTGRMYIFDAAAD